MFIDFQLGSSPTSFEFDIAIIGAGAAGMTLAKALSKKGNLHIGVIESGDLHLNNETQDLYTITNTGHSYYEPYGNRLRFFGGSTNHWGRQIAPLEPHIFTRKDRYNPNGWPITRQSLEFYYKKAHQQLGYEAYKNESFYDPKNVFKNKYDWLKFKPLTFQNRLRRVSSINLPKLYQEEVKNTQNISVILNANVINIIANKNVNQITYCDIQELHTKKTGQVKARFFILACGGIENPRLLLLSNTQNPKGLGNDYSQVGRFFMDHPHIIKSMYLYTNNKIFTSYGYLQDDGVDYVGSIVLTPEFQKNKNCLSATLSWLPVQADEQAKKLGLKVYQVGIASEQAANPDSRVKLGNNLDVLGQRQTVLEWQLQEQDIRTIKYAASLLASELGRKNIANIKLADLRAGNDWVYNSIAGGPHHMGTTRMSDSERTGVVDSNCKVFDFDNFYVAGSSVFPSSGCTNPTLTIIALAYRLADHLLKKIHTV
jgi:choline dehydrogenase-like flavoprotein